MIFRARQFSFEFPRPALVMGIVNVTPDSFSDGGRFLDAKQAVQHALALVAQGADILDIGGESTRPGAEPVNETEELRRVIPVIEQLAPRVRVPLSQEELLPLGHERHLADGRLGRIRLERNLGAAGECGDDHRRREQQQKKRMPLFHRVCSGRKVVGTVDACDSLYGRARRPSIIAVFPFCIGPR